MSSERRALRTLSQRLGILETYRDVDGSDRLTSDATREALVAAMGHDGSTEAGATRALDALDREARERLLEPVLVWREWAEGRPELRLNAAALGDARDYRIELRLESGECESSRGSLPESREQAVVDLPLPCKPPLGYHEIRIELDAPGGSRRGSQRLVMAPRTSLQPEERIGDRAFGIWANAYTLRSGGDGGWGHGGLRELRELGRMAGESGAAFVGINPLHAVTNRGLDYSPYSPSSRLYRNILYLDPEAVPELARSSGARKLLDDPQRRARRVALEAAARIDHEAVLEAMLPVLRELYATFIRCASPSRKQAYADYRDREGSTLRDFAIWETLAEHRGRLGNEPGSAWWRWPAPLRDPDSTAVAAFHRDHADEVDFRCWLQFELDRQLAETDRSLRDAGCTLGLYQDLALGSARASADAWMAQDLFAAGAQVGAPPDAYAPEGQDWGFPPFDPHRLRAQAYRPWSELVRAACTHSGALRIDHAMGLLRLFWIPEGRPGSEGAYVSYRADDLLGILALESRRQDTVLVAEDLGTLPPELPGMLADWGLLRSSVVYFENDDHHFRPTSHYPPRALASVSTHDLAPLAGHFQGSDLDLRAAANGVDPDPAVSPAYEERRQAKEGLVAALRTEGFLAPEGGGDTPDSAGLRDAVHAFLAATPCILASVSLDDLAEERDPVNLPGVPLTSHRSWSRRMSRSLEELSPELRAGVEPMRKRFPASADRD